MIEGVTHHAPRRCQPVKVSGRIETKAFFQLNSLPSNTIVGGPSRLNLTFLVEGQLFPQEKILRG